MTVIIERLVYLRPAKVLPSNLLPEVIAVTRSDSIDAEVLERLENNSPLGRVLAAGVRSDVSRTSAIRRFRSTRGRQN